MHVNSLRKYETAILVALAMTIAGCGGSGNGTAAGGSSSSGSTTTNYTIGGTVLGLATNGTVQIVYGSDSITVKTNGPFTLPTTGIEGSDYSVTVGTTPADQSCGQLNGVGTIEESNVTDIQVFCTDNVSDATLNGTYGIAAFNINADTDQLFTGESFNGTGTLGSANVISNTAGTFTTSTDGGGTYSVTTTDALPLLTVDGNSIGAIAGADADEFYWLANGVTPGGNAPGLALGVNPLLTATMSSFAGDWTTVALTAATTPYVSEESLTINADGSFSGTQTTLDTTGAGTTQAVTGAAGSYAITSGAVLSIGGDSGYISKNGEFAILTSTTQQAGGASANYPGLTAAVKQGTGVTAATLSGVYSIGSLAFITASTSDGESITLNLDGAGNFSGTATENDNGTSTSFSWSGTYTVTSTGALTLTDQTGNVYPGAVSEDGNIFVVAYLTAGGPETPRILVAFRQ
jgi:hypothetical protein